MELFMKNKIKCLVLLLLFNVHTGASQENQGAQIYLLTCGPGSEIYSVYGHSALRVVIPEKKSDLVYNWGVFDFNTTHFAWKFAKGRLNYSLGVNSYESFLREYFLDQRWVVSQKVNLVSEDIEKLFALLAENLKPENITYRYDFFYDDCSSRIRDLMEKTLGDNLIYPPEKPEKELQTFRVLTGEYEKVQPWIRTGIDLLLGSPADKKASFRDRMFLPVELKNGLSELLIRREGKMIPLLQNPQLAVDFKQTPIKGKLFTSPVFILSMLLIALIILTGLIRGKRWNNALDISLFSLFSILAIIMIFFNFFTDHQQTKWNLNIIWLNPFILVCLASLLLKKDRTIWFSLVFYFGVIFLLSLVILPQKINEAYFPLLAILIIRSSVRAGFSWNPLTLPYLTEL
jgi:hypothetical protein